MGTEQTENQTIIIGAGPAGLAAGYTLGKANHKAICLEASDMVGGISRTVERKGYRFDLGGHRFFTKSDEVNALWREILGDEFLLRPRMSRIFYRNHFFAYPVKPLDALKGLGLVEAFLIGLSYAWRKVFPHSDIANFENWTSNLFGDRLYQHFFKAYTEKVWGIPCSEIASEWGSQRIKGLSLFSTIKSALFKPSHGKIKTLIEEFHYPRFGPGQMYEAMAEKTSALGVPVLRNHRVTKINRDGNRIVSIEAETPPGTKTFAASSVISSMPITDLAEALCPQPQQEVIQASRRLSYRSLLTVNLMIDCEETIPDTWMYIHEPSIRMGRLQCFKNWSPHMVADEKKSSLGCEYFVTENEGLWNMSDEELLEIAKEDLAKLGLVDAGKIFDGFVIRVPKAYPVFDLEYRENLEILKQGLGEIKNLQPVGRYGMFRYNNMDHSILTGVLAARNLGGADFDVWNVNTDAEYHEEKRGQ